MVVGTRNKAAKVDGSVFLLFADKKPNLTRIFNSGEIKFFKKMHRCSDTWDDAAAVLKIVLRKHVEPDKENVYLHIGAYFHHRLTCNLGEATNTSQP